MILLIGCVTTISSMPQIGRFGNIFSHGGFDGGGFGGGGFSGGHDDLNPHVGGLPGGGNNSGDRDNQWPIG